MSNEIPLKPGFYWAKWRIPAEGTFEGDKLCPSNTWVIVEVWVNTIDWYNNPTEEEALMVSIPGVRETQLRDCFVWGEFVASPR